MKTYCYKMNVVQEQFLSHVDFKLITHAFVGKSFLYETAVIELKCVDLKLTFKVLKGNIPRKSNKRLRKGDIISISLSELPCLKLIKYKAKCRNCKAVKMVYNRFKDCFCNSCKEVTYEKADKYDVAEYLYLKQGSFTCVALFDKFLCLICDCGFETTVNISRLYYGDYAKFGKCECQKYFKTKHLKSSKGEKLISKILDKNHILYEREKTFDDLYDVSLLRFDFYLPSHNMCIEYDGKQHFEPIDYFGGDKAFKSSKKRDGMKNTYCENNNIKLLRIPYTQDSNIINILSEKLKQIA